MKGNTFKYILFLASVSIAGVFLVQFAFLRTSYNVSEKQFIESTSIALKEVAWQILQASGNTANFDSITPVELISGNCYLVNVNTIIDKELLKNQLQDQLKKHEIFTDFEFAIYNPEEEQMDQGTLISAKLGEISSDYDFTLNDEYTNYFGIHFPDRSPFFHTHLSIWYFFTGLLIVVILFFGYTLSVIVRQRQLSEVQKNFINNLTHELKTPISSISLSANVLTNKEILKTPDRLFRYAKIIQEQNYRLSQNVEKVLNLASLEKNRIRLNLEEVQINSMLNQVVEQFKQTDSGQNVIIKFKLNHVKSDIVLDKFHFTQVILNILENAVKYCETEPEILIELLQEKRLTVLNIYDNGIGIPKDQRKKIFTKFYRIPTGNVHNVKGFGLGLDYVKKIVSAHKWKIKVEENPGGGSIFTISIPG